MYVYLKCNQLLKLTLTNTVWPEKLAGIKFGEMAPNSCKLHLAD